MTDLPNATTTIDDSAGGFAGGAGYIAVLGCAGTNADLTPRVFASAQSFLSEHDYCPSADYIAMHIEETGLPVIFVPMEVATAAVCGRIDSTGVTGTSQITVTAGAAGYLEETEGSIEIVKGGTVGTDLISFDLSLDGGRTTKRVRLGTASTYAIPRVGATLNFGGGTLVAGDTFTWVTTAPLWDNTGLAAARAALAAQNKQVRSWLVVGDLPNATYGGYVVTQANAYETSSKRFIYARGSIVDRSPLAKMSKITKRMVGTPSLTFAEVGGTGDTITRDTGSWVTDGFTTGDLITVSGTSSNNFSSAVVTGVSATVLTLDTQDLVAETTSAATVTASPKLVFAEVGSTGDTVTRGSGSWISDGFKVGDTVSFTGTASNNVSGTIAALSATVLTFDTTDLAAETVRSDAVTAVQVLTMASWVAAKDSAFATIDSEKRVDFSLGRARKLSPITGWLFRRPLAWAASLREYGHDLQIPTYRKSDGPLSGWDMTDGEGRIVEFDERTDGGGLDAKFTCARTYANGPNGAFIALSLTRADEASLLSRTHNLAVTNLACSVVQAETENVIGQVLVLKSDGTATDESLKKIEERVNTKLQLNLLKGGPEGPRASRAVWVASKTDVLNVPGATLNGTLHLELNGTVEKIATVVRVDTNG